MWEAFGIDIPPLDLAAAATAKSQAKGRVAALRELAPDMGAYMNEVRTTAPFPLPPEHH